MNRKKMTLFNYVNGVFLLLLVIVCILPILHVIALSLSERIEAVAGNGYSDLMVEIFGHRGQHARAAMGAYVLPGNMPVSVDAIVKIRR